MTQSIGPPSLAQGTRIAVGFSTSISRFIPACGELSKPSWAIVQLDGSSPLARGTRMNVKKLLSTRRFIPAYAGNSFGQRSLAITLYGSSPLTRGTHPSLNVNKSPARFIPAYAGNSILDIVYLPNHSVHPRLRGELNLQLRGLFDTHGSSPLTRGTQLLLWTTYLWIRFIPAYAGNSIPGLVDHRENSVHPRLRGELIPPCELTMRVCGSSPLTRGTPNRTK